MNIHFKKSSTGTPPPAPANSLPRITKVVRGGSIKRGI